MSILYFAMMGDIHLRRYRHLREDVEQEVYQAGMKEYGRNESTYILLSHYDIM